jgi:hypothetical protein
MEKSNVKITVEELEAIQPKERPLVLDPIVIATFGDLAKDLRMYISCLYKATGYTSQSKRQADLDD